MTTTLAAPATRPQTKPAKPISFDERLALASLAVDARINTTPLNLADVIRIPVETPVPSAPCPYRTPLAVVLHQAQARLERGGWCKEVIRDEDGRRCALGAIRAEAQGDRGVEMDAMTVLLDAVRRRFPGADSVPSWNDSQRDSVVVVRLLGEAAALADARGI